MGFKQKKFDYSTTSYRKKENELRQITKDDLNRMNRSELEEYVRQSSTVINNEIANFRRERNLLKKQREKFEKSGNKKYEFSQIPQGFEISHAVMRAEKKIEKRFGKDVKGFKSNKTYFSSLSYNKLKNYAFELEDILKRKSLQIEDTQKTMEKRVKENPRLKEYNYKKYTDYWRFYNILKEALGGNIKKGYPSEQVQKSVNSFFYDMDNKGNMLEEFLNSSDDEKLNIFTKYVVSEVPDIDSSILTDLKYNMSTYFNVNPKEFEKTYGDWDSETMKYEEIEEEMKEENKGSYDKWQE